MSQYVGLTASQTKVLKRLEEVFPNYRSAAEAAADLGMAVPTALAAMQQLVQLRLAVRGPVSMSETDETKVYQATTKEL
jgi:hypothetical protein